MNPTLTNYAAGVAQDRESALARFIAPDAVVPATIGQYKEYDEKNAFQVYNTARAVGGGATRIEFSSSDPTFNCRPNALEIAIDDSERDAAGIDDTANQDRLEESKTETLISSAVISHEKAVVDATIGTMTAVAGAGVWSNAAVDPIAEIDAQIEAITTATGMMPNRIAFGLSAWRVLRNHSKVTARQPGAAIIGVTFAQIAQMLLNPNIEVRVGVLASDSAKFGVAANKTQIVGAKVLIFYGAENPTQYDPSFAKTFTGRRGSVTAVRTYRAESNRSDILAVDWSEQIKVTSAISGKLLAIS